MGPSYTEVKIHRKSPNLQIKIRLLQSWHKQTSHRLRWCRKCSHL